MKTKETTRDPFLLRFEVRAAPVGGTQTYPNSIPALVGLDRVPLGSEVTFFVGENGSGKSTLVEALAVAAGFNAEGGTRNFRFRTRSSESDLSARIRLVRSARRPRNGFFLRAESFFNVATEIENLDREPAPGPPVIDSYGGTSLHEQSHGESFMALVRNRFGNDGVYIMDEPESALSPARQLALLRFIRDCCKAGSQFIIATHSPILLAYPNATIYELDVSGTRQRPYTELEQVNFTRSFLLDPEAYLRRLFSDD